MWWLLIKVLKAHPWGACACTHAHTIAACTRTGACVYTDLPSYYTYVHHADSRVYAQTHLHTIHSQTHDTRTQTQAHVGVLVCAHRAAFTLYKHTQRHIFRAPYRRETHALRLALSSSLVPNTQAPLLMVTGISETPQKLQRQPQSAPPALPAQAHGFRPLRAPPPGGPWPPFEGC